MTHHATASPPALIVVGASVRALAASARRAGFSVHAADLFADADLRATAVVAVRVPVAPDLPWPAGLESTLRRFPIAPWIYSGALENHPHLVDRLARARPLAGNAGDRLRAVRDPTRLARAVRAAGLAFPETFTAPDGLPEDGSFLVKPLASAGGRGIARWRGGPAAPAGRAWQRFVAGRPWSAAFVIGSDGPRLFGASRQLVGRRWCGARGFAWCGAIDVPIDSIEPALRARLERLGIALAGDFGLVGLVGVDLVVDPAGTAHVVEVNPRPTATLELVERATGESVVATHLAACGVAPPIRDAAPRTRTTAWAKAVVFADLVTEVTEERDQALAHLAARWTEADEGWPALADVPVAGESIAAGAPILTVFAAGRSAASALGTLRRRVMRVREALPAGATSHPGTAR